MQSVSTELHSDMQVEFVTVDVFTDRQFGGNPLAVVADGTGLSTSQMQAIASPALHRELRLALCVRRTQGPSSTGRCATSHRRLCAAPTDGPRKRRTFVCPG